MQVGVQALSWTRWHKIRDMVQAACWARSSPCRAPTAAIIRRAIGIGTSTPDAGPRRKGDKHIDWKQWLGSAPQRPFDADRFFRFRKYWDYSGGIATDLHYHIVAPFHLALDNEHPTRVVRHGRFVGL